MNSVQDWLDAYGKSHKNPINKKIHWVCVPLIMLSLLGLLWPLSLNLSSYFNAATVLIFLAGIYYFRLSISMGIGMLFMSFMMLSIIYYINQYNLGLAPYLAIFSISWAGQFIGHKIEGKKPSFFEDLQFLLIGPLWLLSQLYNSLKIKY